MQEVLRQSRKTVGTGLKELQQQQKHYETQLARDHAEQLADAEIQAAFGDFDTLWKSVSQREQGKLMEVLVERVEYDPHEVAISVSFHRSGIKALAAKADEVLV